MSSKKSTTLTLVLPVAKGQPEGDATRQVLDADAGGSAVATETEDFKM